MILSYCRTMSGDVLLNNQTITDIDGLPFMVYDVDEGYEDNLAITNAAAISKEYYIEYKGEIHLLKDLVFELDSMTAIAIVEQNFPATYHEWLSACQYLIDNQLVTFGWLSRMLERLIESGECKPFYEEKLEVRFAV